MNDRTLVCSDLTMRFGGLVALDAFSLEVRPGEVVGLLGPNGSGKTTFFNVVTGLYKPVSGAIRFGDKDLFRKAPSEINHAGIARSFQRCRLMLELSVFDNLLVVRTTGCPTACSAPCSGARRRCGPSPPSWARRGTCAPASILTSLTACSSPRAAST